MTGQGTYRRRLRKPGKAADHDKDHTADGDHRSAPRLVFGALINEKRHARFTGHTAAISRKVGGTSRATGATSPGSTSSSRRRGGSSRPGARRRGLRASFPSSRSRSREQGGPHRLSFTQVGVPISVFKNISKGWRTYYWKPLKAYLKGKSLVRP